MLIFENIGNKHYKYLAELQDKGLLFYNKGDRTFITTAQGEEYLRLYAAMDNLGKK